MQGETGAQGTSRIAIVAIAAGAAAVLGTVVWAVVYMADVREHNEYVRATPEREAAERAAIEAQAREAAELEAIIAAEKLEMAAARARRETPEYRFAEINRREIKPMATLDEEVVYIGMSYNTVDIDGVGDLDVYWNLSFINGKSLVYRIAARMEVGFYDEDGLPIILKRIDGNSILLGASDVFGMKRISRQEWSRLHRVAVTMGF